MPAPAGPHSPPRTTSRADGCRASGRRPSSPRSPLTAAERREARGDFASRSSPATYRPHGFTGTSRLGNLRVRRSADPPRRHPKAVIDDDRAAALDILLLLADAEARWKQ